MVNGYASVPFMQKNVSNIKKKLFFFKLSRDKNCLQNENRQPFIFYIYKQTNTTNATYFMLTNPLEPLCENRFTCEDDSSMIFRKTNYLFL